MGKNVIKNEVLAESYVAGENILSNVSVGTWQENYQLTQVDFERIKNDKPITYSWAMNSFMATVGFGLTLIPKLYLQFMDNKTNIQNGEWLTLVIGIVISLILYGIGSFMPNNYKCAINDIEKHFKNATKHKTVWRRSQ